MGFRTMASPSARIFLFIGLSWICIGSYYLLPLQSLKPYLTSSPDSRSSPNILPSIPSSLHLIVPASSPDQNLCKILLTSSILGYPAPIVPNWNQTFDDPRFVAGGSHLAKIGGVATYLSQLEAAQDEDLVLMVDGYDTWIQLRPQTLVGRFYDINRKADRRLEEELGRDVVEKWGIRQEVVFGVQKRCWPWTFDDPPCYAAPESTLPEDIYGPDTDTDVGYEPNPYIKFRPRYTNSGVVMGTARAMRKLFLQAAKQLREAEGEANMGSDQYIFSHIIGDQNVWREAMRRDAIAESASKPSRGRSLGSLFSSSAVKKKTSKPIPWNEQHIAELRHKASLQPDGRFEFGIGYDHWSLLGLHTVFAEDETEWLTWSNTTELASVESQYSLPSSSSRLRSFPTDIAETTPPFWTFNDEPLLPRDRKWEEIPLFTDVYTGVVPVVIHHNAHRDGRKALRESWWDRIWLFPWARRMFDSSVYEPIVPIAYGGGERDGARREFWPSERWKGGIRTVGTVDEAGNPIIGEWFGFDDVCRDYHEEVFRDGIGAWRLMEAH